MTPAAIPFTVAFDEVDGEGIVFFANYFRLAHRALEAWLPGIGINWEEWFANPGAAAPLRQASADFLRPLRAGARFDVAIELAELGESSVKFEFRFLDPAGGEFARLSSLHVFVDRASGKKTAIPVELRRRLAAVEPL